MNTSETSRVTRTKKEAKASYDRLSKWYDLLAGESEKKYQDIGLRMLNVQVGETVLEIGFGTGKGILSLARLVGDMGRVYGLDISEGMLNATRSRVRKAGLADRVGLGCGDAVTMSYPNGSLDAIFMCFTLELFDTPEIPLVLKECQRVLRRQGRACVVAMSNKGKANLMTKLYDWGHLNIQNYVDCRPIDVQETLEEAGFVVMQAKMVPMWGLPVEIVLVEKA